MSVRTLMAEMMLSASCFPSRQSHASNSVVRRRLELGAMATPLLLSIIALEREMSGPSLPYTISRLPLIPYPMFRPVGRERVGTLRHRSKDPRASFRHSFSTSKHPIW